MPTSVSFDYAVLRVVPRVERQEFVNAGVIVLCRERRFLAARVLVGEARLLALWPGLSLSEVQQHVHAVTRICAGDSAAGPIARLTESERFHWLTAPRSTIMQTSQVHTGLCSEVQDLDELVDRLFDQLVTQPPPRRTTAGTS